MKEKSTFSILDRMFLCFLAVVMVLSTIVISANKIVVYAVLSEQAGSFFGEEDISYAVPMTVRAKQKANTYDINGNIEPNRWIDVGDYCYIDKVYKNGFCHVQYPTSNGMRWAYVDGRIFSIMGSLVNENSPQIVVDDKTVSVGSEVKINISLKNNPGISSMGLNLKYDNTKLTLKAINYNSAMGGQSMQPQNTDSPIILNWISPIADYSGDSTYAELVFKVSDKAESGTTLIEITYDSNNVYNLNDENIAFEVKNGTVTIIDYIPGDINNDGSVNNKDFSRLFQYLSGWKVEVNQTVLDVNGDGSINNKDATRLFQYVSGWSVEIFPQKVSKNITGVKRTYGKSELGKELVYYDYKPENYTNTVLLNFAIHGYEDEYPADAQILVKAAENLIAHYNGTYPENCKTRLIIIPCANPDGLYDGTTNNGFGRCNANGVDLNRDFDANYRSYSSARNYTQYPFSAAESRALRDLYMDVKPLAVIDFHGWENCTIGNYELAQIFEDEMGLSHKVSFMTNNASGYFSNWAYQQGSYSLLVEFTNSRSVNENKLIKSVDRLIKGEYEVSPKDETYQKFDTITCYTLSTGHEKTYQYFNKPYSSESYIDGQTDEVVILRIYENGWVNAQYPITNGYKAAFCTLDKFISPSEKVQMYKLNVSSNTTVYKRKDLSEYFGKVYPTDEIYVVAQTNNALQVIYTLDSGGWKMGWISKS